MGAPMNAFVRVNDNPVRNRSQVYEPDFVIIVDATLMRGYNCLAGLSDKGIAVISQREGIQIPRPKLKQKLYVVPANKIAQEAIGKPLGNTALLGAYAAATGQMDLKTIQEAVKSRFNNKPKIQQANLEAVKRGFEYIKNL